MKLIEHLEYVIKLVEETKPHSEIKAALCAMHQEVEGYDQAPKPVQLSETFMSSPSLEANIIDDVHTLIDRMEREKLAYPHDSAARATMQATQENLHTIYKKLHAVFNVPLV
jgi:hypothetical protein